MGEAIARFRDMALAIRRVCDERHSQPRGRAVKPEATKTFAKECRLHLLDYEKAGMNYPARHVRGLCKIRNRAERHPDPPPPGEFDLPLYIEWLPEPFAKKEPGHSEIRKAAREALKEAVRFGDLFTLVEARIKALDAAADMLANYAGSERYENPPEEDFDEDPEGGTYHHTPSPTRADEDYIARHEEFADALEALAPFIEEPPATASSSTSEKQTSTAKQKKRRDRKGVGGRPDKYPMKFIREVFTARERDKKHAAIAKQRLPAWAPWLWDYCHSRITIAEMFPPAFEGEPWEARAERFKKAAKKRLREAETNRH